MICKLSSPFDYAVIKCSHHTKIRFAMRLFQAFETVGCWIRTVQGSLSRDLCPGISVQRSLSRDLCPGISVQGSLSRDLCPGISVQGSLSRDLCPDGLCLGEGGLCQGEPRTEAPTVKERVVRVLPHRAETSVDSVCFLAYQSILTRFYNGGL